MKGKKCPYCGIRIRYNSIFRTKKHGAYCCERCKKESKVKISNKMILLFVALCLLMVLFIIFWVATDNTNNIFGVIFTSLCFMAFYFVTPLFVNFVPLKKYVNDIGNSKQYEEKINIESVTQPTDFVFNREAFDKIKRQKESGMLSFDVEQEKENKSENMVHVIENVKEGHISSSSAPLHKINRTPKQYDHKYEQVFEEIQSEEEIKKYVPKKKKPDGSKYTANRRF